MALLLRQVNVLLNLTATAPSSPVLIKPSAVEARNLALFWHSKANRHMSRTIYDFTVKNIKGQEISLVKYEGKVCLIVNVASKCGFTKQYEGLQKLYETYKSSGFEILAFPCNQFNGQEPGSEKEIQSFCSARYGVNFDMFAKIDVNGSAASPLFEFLKDEKHGILTNAIKWNFTKFLVDRTGKPVKRYAPQDEPVSIEKDIRQLLSNEAKL